MSSTLPPPHVLGRLSCPCGQDAKSKNSQGELRLGDRIITSDQMIHPRQSFWAYRVKCIDASESSLRVGKIYTVAAYTYDGLLELKNCRGAFGRWRFEPVAPKPKKPVRPIGPDLPSTPFKPGDLARCRDARYEQYGIVPGRTYRVLRVLYGKRFPSMLTFRELMDGKRPMLASLFELVDETPYVGNLDEYGPATEDKPVDPIFRAIGRRWSSHPSDAVIHLDELARR